MFEILYHMLLPIQPTFTCEVDMSSCAPLLSSCSICDARCVTTASEGLSVFAKPVAVRACRRGGAG